MYCIVQYYSAVYCTLLYHIIIQCTILYCNSINCNALLCIVIYFTVLYCIISNWTVLYCFLIYSVVLHQNSNTTKCTPPFHFAVPDFLPTTSSLYRIWNNGHISKFKVSKQLYWSFRHDRNICKWRQCLLSGQKLN